MRLPSLAIVLVLGLAGCQTDRDGVAINLTALRQVLRHRHRIRPAQIDRLTRALTPPQHNDLGVLYEREGRLDDAIRQYQLAISKDCRFATAYVNLGNVRRKQGQEQEALFRYRQAMAADPNNLAGVNNFADLCADLGQHLDEAIARLSAALEAQAAPNAYGLDTLGRLYCAAGQPERALPVLESALELAGGNDALAATIHCHLALAYAALGRLPEAAHHAQHARDLGCTPRQAAQLGRALGQPGSESDTP